MTSQNSKAWLGIIFLVTFLGVILFLPAGTFYYKQAWAYLFLVTTSVIAITLYLMKNDPELLKRRTKIPIKDEKEKSQKLIQILGQISFLTFYLIPALDHRFSWTHVPFIIELMSYVLVVLGFFIVFLVFKQNTFTSAIIEVEKKQHVISTGMYAMVRHPMYVGVLLVLLVTPLALGSYIGLIAFPPMLYVIVERLREEEKFLRGHLSGYDDYCKKVPWRLLPGVF